MVLTPKMLFPIEIETGKEYKAVERAQKHTLLASKKPKSKSPTRMGTRTKEGDRIHLHRPKGTKTRFSASQSSTLQFTSNRLKVSMDLFQSERLGNEEGRERTPESSNPVP